MRVLVTGGGGLLGGELARSAPRGVDLAVTVRERPAPAGEPHRVDLADAQAVRALFRALRPGLVIHTAYDPVDLSGGIVAATRAVAAACAEVRAELVHLSSDRVLDGEHSPYDEGAAPAPIDPYGEAKARAEVLAREAVPGAAVIRTSLIVGPEADDRNTARMFAALRAGEALPLFVDEIRCPTYVGDLASQIWELTTLPAAARAGVWNLAAPEALSRYALGILLARRYGVDASSIVPALNRQHAVRRPRDLRLTTVRADGALRTRARPISEALFVE